MAKRAKRWLGPSTRITPAPTSSSLLATGVHMLLQGACMHVACCCPSVGLPYPHPHAGPARLCRCDVSLVAPPFAPPMVPEDPNFGGLRFVLRVENTRKRQAWRGTGSLVGGNGQVAKQWQHLLEPVGECRPHLVRIQTACPSTLPSLRPGISFAAGWATRRRRMSSSRLVTPLLPRWQWPLDLALLWTPAPCSTFPRSAARARLRTHRQCDRERQFFGLTYLKPNIHRPSRCSFGQAERTSSPSFW